MPDDNRQGTAYDERHFDVIVIGAGVAGAMSSLLASRAGFRTLLIDRQKFPRNKVCGCCINDRAVRILTQAGLRPQLDLLAPAITHSLAIKYGGRGLKVPMPQNIAVSRRVFDQWLIDQAVAAGCRFLDNVTASVDPLAEETSVAQQSSHERKSAWDHEDRDSRVLDERSVRLQYSDRTASGRMAPEYSEDFDKSPGQIESPVQVESPDRSKAPESDGGECDQRGQPHWRPSQVFGRVVLVCDGLGHPSLHRMDLFQAVPVAGSRIGLGAVFPRTPADDWILPQEILMAVSPHGYAGVVEIENQQLNLAAAVDPWHLQRTKSPLETLRSIFYSAGTPVPAGLAEATVRGTVPLTRSATRISGHRLFLLGDSTGYVEPFTGEGMAWALTAATAVMPLVTTAIHDTWSTELSRRWQTAFQGIVRREQKFCRLLSAALRRPWMLPPVLSVCRVFPAATQYFVRKINRVPEALETNG